MVIVIFIPCVVKIPMVRLQTKAKSNKAAEWRHHSEGNCHERTPT